MKILNFYLNMFMDLTLYFLFRMPITKAAELCEEYFDWRLKAFPEYATFCGFHEHDGFLNDHSVEAFQRRVVCLFLR